MGGESWSMSPGGKRGNGLREWAEKLLAEDTPSVKDIPGLIDRLQRRRIEVETKIDKLRNMLPEEIESMIEKLEKDLASKAETIERLRQELADSRYYRHLYCRLTMACFTLGRNREILEVNETGAWILGIEPHKLFKEKFISFVAKSSQDTLRKQFRRVSGTGIAASEDIKLRKNDGSLIPVRLQTIPLPSGGKNSPAYFVTIVDITRQEATDKALKASEENYRDLLANLMEGVIRIDANGVIHSVNASAAYAGEEIAGKHLYSFTDENSVDTFREIIRENNILERIMANAGAMLAYLDPDFNFVRANEAYAGWVGCPVEALVGRNYFELVPNPSGREAFNRVKQTGETQTFHDQPVINTINPNEVKYWDVTLSAVRERNGAVQGLVLSMTETTQRKREEESNQRLRNELEIAVAQRTAQLLESNQELQNEITERKLLTRRLVDVQESERQNIARELHDQLGQSLALLKLFLDKAVQDKTGQTPFNFSQAQSVVMELINHVRNLSLDLRPKMLDSAGLLQTLYWHFNRYTARTGVRVNFRHGGLHRGFSAEVNTTVYRIVQESLNNVIKHAKVPEVAVRVWSDGQTVSVHIKDNGVGFDPVKMDMTNCTGLSGMRERVGLLGGEFMICSSPGAGTTINARLPVSGLI